MNKQIKSEVKDFKALLKSEFQIETKSRNRQDSIFSLVKSEMKKENKSKDEVVFNILSELKTRNLEINQDLFKKVNKLLSNLLTYVRKSYSGYEDKTLIESNGKFQIIEKKVK